MRRLVSTSALRARGLAVSVLTVVLLAACAPTASAPSTLPTPGKAIPTTTPHPACAAEDFLVTIPDENLAVSIRRQLELKANQELRCSHLASMTTLMASGVADLSGLEHAVRLSNLTVRASSVSSLTPIVDLTRLTTLNLPGSQLTSVELLTHLPSLVAIDISNNAVSDISPLASLPGLTFLAATGNGITDISPLAEHLELAWLELSDNQITDISALTGHTKLSTLLLNDNMIVDGSPLAAATGLNRLEMANNRLTNVDFMSDIEPRNVILSGNLISNINGITRNAYLDGSRTVDLRNNCIDLESSDPFIRDVLERGEQMLLVPQREDCGEAASG